MFITANHTGHHGVRQVAPLLVLATLSLAGRLGAAFNPKFETVSVYLNVEKNGDLVTGLTEQNFRLYEDGKPQSFRLEKVEEPASIAVLVEYSRSSGYFLEDIDGAMKGLLKHAQEGHWYGFATFSHELEIHTDFVKEIGLITEAYSQLGIPLWNEIDTNDAVYEMLDRIGRLPGRRILIVIGSGIDTFSEHTFDDVKKKVESENVTVFVAGVGSVFRTVYDASLGPSAQMTLMQSRAFLQMLADKSGGYAWFPTHFNAFPDVMLGMMQSVASQYRLVYDSAARGSGKFHKIRIEAFRMVDDKCEDFKVLAREGWR